MHGTRKSKASVRGSTTDLVSAYDVNIVPGLGAVSTSNIIAGGRMRKGARANDDRSGQKGGEAPIDASLSPSKVRKTAQEKKGKRLKTMLAVQEDSRKTVAPTPTVATAAGTLIYQNSYGDTEAPAEALASDKEVDYMPDGNILISQPSKGSKSAEPEATQNHNNSIAKAVGKARGNKSGNDNAVARANNHNNSLAKAVGKAPGNQSGNDDTVAIADYHNNFIAKSGGKAPGKNQSGNDKAVASNQSDNDNAVASSDYAVASADYHFKTRGSGRSGRTRKPPAKKL
jgi:hypothetical protein